MSASWPGSMRGPRVKTPRLLRLLLLWLLLNSLSGTGLCQDYDDTPPDDGAETEDAADPESLDGGDTQPSETPQADPETETDPTITEGDPPSEGETSGAPEENVSETTETSSVSPVTTGDGVGEEEVGEGLNPIIILIPVVLVVLIIGMIVCGIFINRRWKNQVTNQELRKEDPYLDGSSTEKVPMPMFEEDVPSVLELEMEELDQWMKKDGEAADDSKHV